MAKILFLPLLYKITKCGETWSRHGEFTANRDSLRYFTQNHAKNYGTLKRREARSIWDQRDWSIAPLENKFDFKKRLFVSSIHKTVSVPLDKKILYNTTSKSRIDDGLTILEFPSEQKKGAKMLMQLEKQVWNFTICCTRSFLYVSATTLCSL